jgi:hypothetical protein
LIPVEGMDHAWPAASGPGPVVDYVASEGVNNPAYVTAFFFEDNRRVNPPPSIDACQEVSDRVVPVGGSVTDSGRAELSITITGFVNSFSEFRENVQLSAEGNSKGQFGPLPDDNVYRTTLVAKDEQGALATLKLPDFDVGNRNHPPADWRWEPIQRSSWRPIQRTSNCSINTVCNRHSRYIDLKEVGMPIPVSSRPTSLATRDCALT